MQDLVSIGKETDVRERDGLDWLKVNTAPWSEAFLPSHPVPLLGTMQDEWPIFY